MKTESFFILIMLFLLLTVPSMARAETDSQGLSFARSLYRGLSGDDVKNLQALLAADSEVYPEGMVTGFYGALTEKAVKAFQKKHGIEQAGIFGPKTKAKLLALFQGKPLPAGIAKKTGSVSSTTPSGGTGGGIPASSTVTLCHTPPGSTGNKQTISVGGTAVKEHLDHGDTVGACGGANTDRTAPVISGVTVSSVGTTTAQVRWNTNELAQSSFWFGIVSPLDISTSTAFQVSTTNYGTAHQVGLSGLMASTTVYYLIQVKDAAGNIATTSEQRLTTLVQ